MKYKYNLPFFDLSNDTLQCTPILKVAELWVSKAKGVRKLK